MIAATSAQQLGIPEKRVQVAKMFEGLLEAFLKLGFIETRKFVSRKRTVELQTFMYFYVFSVHPAGTTVV